MIKSDTLRSIELEDLQSKMNQACDVMVTRDMAVRFLHWLDRQPRALDNIARDFWYSPNPADITSPIAFEDLTMTWLMEEEGYADEPELTAVDAEAYLLPDWLNVADDYGITIHLTEWQVEAVAEEIVNDARRDGVALGWKATVLAIFEIVAKLADASRRSA